MFYEQETCLKSALKHNVLVYKYSQSIAQLQHGVLNTVCPSANVHSGSKWSRSPIHHSVSASPRVMSSSLMTLCSSSLCWIARCPPRLSQVWAASDQLIKASLKYQQLDVSFLTSLIQSLWAWSERTGINWLLQIYMDYPSYHMATEILHCTLAARC